MEKPEKTKEKIVTQNASICTGMKIESIFWLSTSKKNGRTSSLVVEVTDAKMANMLIEEELVLDHTLHGCMRYNPACRMKQYFNFYKYGHVLVHFQKTKKCRACSGSHRISECPQVKRQKCPLYNAAHTSCDKRCEYRKKKYRGIEAAKQNIPRMHETSLKPTLQRRESRKEMRPPPRPQQRSQSINTSSSTQTRRHSAPSADKRGRSSSNDRPSLQTTFGNASRFTAPAKVQIFEKPTTKSQNQEGTSSQSRKSIDTFTILQYNIRKSRNIVMIALFQNDKFLEIDIVALQEPWNNSRD